MFHTLPRLLCLGAVSFALGCGGPGEEYRPLSAEQVEQPSEPATASPSSESPTVEPAASGEKADLAQESSATPAASGEAMPASEGAPTQASPEEGQVATATPSGDTSASMPAEAKAGSKPLEIKLLIPNKEFVKEGASQSLRVTFDDLDLLKVCNMEPVPPDVMDHLPDWLKNLNGQKIILRGWMFPSGRQEGISSFMFVRDNGICCFGRDPKVYDKLAVTMQPGKTTSYIAGRPFDVEATLLIEPDIEGSEEGLWWLYRLEGARVIDQ
ncbi:hypothetical protein SH661x_001404 [Planctomicrobium sp. SH661]|uniref:hypothetical protein n=1 Tax=Planctomicrobium sp. SH661 TaxID=3448124 RepID=UPI003F5C211C